MPMTRVPVFSALHTFERMFGRWRGQPPAPAAWSRSAPSVPSPKLHSPAAAAAELLSRLPAGMLRATEAHCPRLTEAIACAWSDAAALHDVLDTWERDARDGRLALPPAVLAEIGEMRRCYERWVGRRPRAMH